MKKTGVLLVNLGSPGAPNFKSVFLYLKRFLSDPYVIDLPFILRWILLIFIILPFRTFRSTKAYQAIWRTEGSPLLFYSQNLKNKLSEQLPHITCVLGMRYGNPSIDEAIQTLQKKACEVVILFPLFPQYSKAVTESIIYHTQKKLKQYGYAPQLKIQYDFFNNSHFIHAQSSHLHHYLKDKNIEYYLLSYHGLPEHHIVEKGCTLLSCYNQSICLPLTHFNRFCYRAQCYATSNALAKRLHLKDYQYKTVFQSRLGKTPWIKPYTDKTLIHLAHSGIKQLAIICPSFVVDCLETLEEIGIRAKQQWQALGGETLYLVPALNTEPVWVESLTKMITELTHENYCTR